GENFFQHLHRRRENEKHQEHQADVDQRVHVDPLLLGIVGDLGRNLVNGGGFKSRMALDDRPIRIVWPTDFVGQLIGTVLNAGGDLLRGQSGDGVRRALVADTPWHGMVLCSDAMCRMTPRFRTTAEQAGLFGVKSRTQSCLTMLPDATKWTFLMLEAAA